MDDRLQKPVYTVHIWSVPRGGWWVYAIWGCYFKRIKWMTGYKNQSSGHLWSVMRGGWWVGGGGGRQEGGGGDTV